METADDFIKAFLEANPQAKNGDLSMEELNQLLAGFQNNLNSEPQEDFDGLSPSQMHVLLNFPFSPECIIRFRNEIDAFVDESPFFQLCELLLFEIKKVGKLKLTKDGNLPVHICKFLVEQNLISWEYMHLVKRITEAEIPYLWPLKHYIINEGIVLKRKNALSLTKRGEQLLQGKKSDRFISVFHFMAGRLNWGNFYHIDDNGMSGQLGWAFSLALLSKYGHQFLPSEFYSVSTMEAFEKELFEREEEDRAVQEYHDAYRHRFFKVFAHWFGLVQIKQINKDPSTSIYRGIGVTKSELFDKLIQLEDWKA